MSSVGPNAISHGASLENLAQALHAATSETGKLAGRKVYLIGDSFVALSNHELNQISDKHNHILMTADKIELFIASRPPTSPIPSHITQQINADLKHYKDNANDVSPKTSKVRNILTNLGSKILNSIVHYPGRTNSNVTDRKETGQMDRSQEKEKMKEEEPHGRSERKENESSDGISRSNERSLLSDGGVISKNRAYIGNRSMAQNPEARDSSYFVPRFSDKSETSQVHTTEFVPVVEANSSVSHEEAVEANQIQGINIDLQVPVSAQTLAKVALNGKQWMDSVNKIWGQQHRLEPSVSEKHIMLVQKNVIFIQDKISEDPENKGNFKEIRKGVAVATRHMRSLKKQQQFQSTGEVFQTQAFTKAEILTNEKERAEAEKVQKNENMISDIVIKKLGSVEGSQYLAPKYKVIQNQTRGAFIQGGNLTSALANGKIIYKGKEIEMTQELRLIAAVQMVKGMQALHQMHVIHRDLHPGNIMFKTTERADGKIGITVKIIDFGLSAKQNDKPVNEKIFRTHIPVEEFGKAEFKGTTPDFDQYQMAITLYQLFTGNAHPYNLPTNNTVDPNTNMSNMDMVIKDTYNAPADDVVQLKKTPKEILVRQPECIKKWPGFGSLQPPQQKLLLDMLAPNPNDRPSEEEVLQKLEAMSQGIENAFTLSAPSSDNQTQRQISGARGRTIYNNSFKEDGNILGSANIMAENNNAPNDENTENSQLVLNIDNSQSIINNNLQRRPGDYATEYGNADFS